jgi:hypothetical protein
MLKKFNPISTNPLSRAEHETTDGEQKNKGAILITTLIISTTNNI